MRFAAAIVVAVSMLAATSCKPAHVDQDSAPTPVTQPLEVTASSGPIKLSLRLYSRQVHAGEPVYVQLSVTNISTEAISFADQTFFRQQMLADRGSLANPPAGTSIRVIGSDGTPVSLDMPLGSDVNASISRQPASAEEQRQLDETDRKIAQWKRAGLSEKTIRLKLIEYSRELNRESATAGKVVWLKPGESLQPPSWRAEYERAKHLAVPTAFTELPYYDFRSTGTYRISAIYRNSQPDWMQSVVPNAKRYPADVDVETPPLTFEVVQ